ncbi:MAG: CvpA family protein [Clostridia bacterium]|nr:CvpA family protein [Clostridia bacterium]
MAQLCIAQFKGAFVADIVFFILLFLFAFLNARKGFIGCFFSFVSTIVAVLVALFCAGGFQSLTGGLFGLQGLIGTGLGNAFSGVPGLNIDIGAAGATDNLTQASLPQFLKDKVLEIMGSADLPAGTTLAMQVGDVLAQFIVSMICAVVLFFLVKLLMKLLKKVLTHVAESMTAIRKVNRLLGMLVGVLKAMAITCLVLAILSLFASEGMTNFFNDTILLSGLYNNNPIHAVFGLFIS